jgi:hypothetical protein
MAKRLTSDGSSTTWPGPKHFIGGHLGRLGTRDDVTLHQQYMADISENEEKSV